MNKRNNFNKYINEIIDKLKIRALEHDDKSKQYFKEDCSFLAKEEYDKRDGLYEAIEIIKEGVRHG